MSLVIISTLQADFLDQNIDQFLEVEKDLQKDFPPKLKTWEAKHYLMDLDGKWTYSRVALDHSGRVLGFIIASRKNPGIIHIHRVGMLTSHRRQGIFSRMLRALVAAVKRDGLTEITLFALVVNAQVWQHYLREGFEFIQGPALITLLSKQSSSWEYRCDYVMMEGLPYYAMRLKV